MFNSLRPHGLQHSRLPCSSSTPGVHSNSCPLSQWCHLTISSSVIPFFSCLQSFPASQSFQMSQLFKSSGQGTGVSASASVLWCSAFFTVQLSHPYMMTGKTVALFGKVMSLLFNMLPRLVITFLPRSERLVISWLQSPSAVILEPPKIKSVTVSTVSPSICHEVMGLDARISVFWMLSFKPTFSLSSRVSLVLLHFLP